MLKMRIKYFLKKNLPRNIINLIKSIIALTRFLKETIWIISEKIKRIFYRPKLPNTKKFGTNIHLGCGPINHEAFINIDGFPFPHIHYVRDIGDLSIFSDNSVDLIYASHCLEHFHYAEVGNVLKEWQRVLKKGGILRVSVPDFDLLLKIYYDNDMNPDNIIPQLLGGQNNKYNFHYMVFNKQNLTMKLKEAGFSDIVNWTPNSSAITAFDDFSDYLKEVNGQRYPVSLNLEASKV